MAGLHHAICPVFCFRTDGMLNQNMKDVEIVQIVNGQRMAERIPVTSLGGRRYRLEGSPALIQGLAAGDEIELESEGFRLLKRGGNVCAHIVMRTCNDAARKGVNQLMEKIEGWLDGEMEVEGKCILVCTAPVLASFAVIEETLDEIARKYRAEGWMYGNVYDEDGEPLTWWPE
jgi:hypothetical protein